nr:hypothetical protein pA8H1_p45 [Arthrobacter sp.]
MSTPRRPKGSVKDPIPLGWRVERESRDTFTRLAAKAGISGAALFDMMVQSLELDDRGLPTWVPREDSKGQLPIDTP